MWSGGCGNTFNAARVDTLWDMSGDSFDRIRSEADKEEFHASDERPGYDEEIDREEKKMSLLLPAESQADGSSVASQSASIKRCLSYLAS